MSEFVLNKSGRVQIANAPFQGATLSFDALDHFTQGYLEALFFTSNGPEEGQLRDSGFSDLSEEALEACVVVCKTFQADNAELLALAYARDDYDETQAGRDLWFTRNGHGVGFWDRDQLDAEGLGDRLSEPCRKLGNVDAYLGDDGKIYLM